MKHQTEADIESECMGIVTEHGGEYRKLDVGIGAKGWLDDAVWLPNWHFVVEFKKPGEKPTALQRRRIRRLRALGVEVHVIDDVATFSSLVAWGLDRARGHAALAPAPGSPRTAQ